MSTEQLSADERELLTSELGLGISHLNAGTVVSNGDVVAKVLRIIDAQARELRELERFAARVVLESFDAEECLAPVDTPANVAALVQRCRGYAVGECESCGKRAPLKRQLDGRHYMFVNSMPQVCVWGCEEPVA